MIVAAYLGTGGFRATGPIVEQVVDCTGMENELQECFTPNKRILDSGCTAQEFAGIICGTQNGTYNCRQVVRQEW